MHKPPEDFLVIYCRGRCGKYQTHAFSELIISLRNWGQTLNDFRNGYVCSECDRSFVVLIETLNRKEDSCEQKALTLNDAPEPN
jgi:hypothetical protein